MFLTVMLGWCGGSRPALSCCTAPPVGSFERVGAVSSSLSEQGFGNKHWTILKSWGDLAPVLYRGTRALHFPPTNQVPSGFRNSLRSSRRNLLCGAARWQRLKMTVNAWHGSSHFLAGYKVAGAQTSLPLPGTGAML